MTIPKPIKSLLWKFLPACKEVVRLISLERDNGISVYQKIQVRLHLLICSWCSKYLKQLELLEERLRSGPPAPETLDPDVAQRMKQSLRKTLE